MMKRLKQYMIAGVVALAPLLITVLLINWLIDLSARFSAWIPEPYRLQTLLGINLPGFDIVFAFLFIILFGAATVHFIGNNLMKWFDLLMEQIPFVRGIQKGTRQLFGAIFGEGPGAFKKVVLVEFPQPGQWVIGFISGEGSLPGTDSDTEGNFISVFIPSTPLPTTGWLVYVEPKHIKHLDLTVDQGMKIVLSGGVLPAHKSKVKQS